MQADTYKWFYLTGDCSAQKHTVGEKFDIPK